jgi:hypothetical protein
MRAVLLAKATAATLGFFAFEQIAHPALASSLAGHSQDSRRPNDQKASKVAVAHLADAALAFLSATAVGARREPQPRRKLPARFEQRRIRRAGGHGAGGDRPDAPDGR